MPPQSATLLAGLLAIAILLTLPITAASDDSQWSAGIRANVLGGDGEPSNDTLGVGLFGRYQVNGKWLVGFGLDIATGFDVEEPDKFVGLIQEAGADVIDADADAYTVMAWIERQYRRDQSKWSWFWTAGAGVSSVSVETATGPLEGGGMFDISIDAGTEFVLSVSGGFRRQLGKTWELELALRLDEHLADWKVVDRVSGATGSIDDYLIRGVTIGILKSF